MPKSTIEESVRRYYDAKLEQHGTSARGVDWSSEQSQELRFRQLVRLLDEDASASLLDFGCGYGALVRHLRRSGWHGSYVGLDLSQAMIDAARSLNPDDGRFVTTVAAGDRFDFVVASGIFNVRLDIDNDTWIGYVNHTLDRIDLMATRGWAVNMLTSYSDADHMRADLHYADPRAYFDRCITTYSRKVAILHDYGLYEFTLLVRR
jgi:SAM-dependent methyltransferase